MRSNGTRTIGLSFERKNSARESVWSPTRNLLAPLSSLLSCGRLDTKLVSEKPSHSSVDDRLRIRVCTIPSTKLSSPSAGTSSPR